MISEKMLKALNEQIKEELFSEHLYKAMALDFSFKNWKGMAHWMTLQAKEENNHAMKLAGFLLDHGVRPILPALDKPQESWDSPLKAFEAAYSHEKHITSCIHNLLKAARSDSDIASEVFLQWYVLEQVEEEANASEIIERIKALGDSKAGLVFLDKELGKRE